MRGPGNLRIGKEKAKVSQETKKGEEQQERKRTRQEKEKIVERKNV